jgi:hypothetical protein
LKKTTTKHARSIFDENKVGVFHAPSKFYFMVDFYWLIWLAACLIHLNISKQSKKKAVPCSSLFSESTLVRSTFIFDQATYSTHFLFYWNTLFFFIITYSQMSSHQVAADYHTENVWGKRKPNEKSQLYIGTKKIKISHEDDPTPVPTGNETAPTPVPTGNENRSVLGKRKRNEDSQSHYNPDAGREGGQKRMKTIIEGRRRWREGEKKRRQELEEEKKRLHELEEEKKRLEKLEQRRQLAHRHYQEALNDMDEALEILANPNLPEFERVRYRSLYLLADQEFIVTAPHLPRNGHKFGRCPTCREGFCNLCSMPLAFCQEVTVVRGCRHAFHSSCMSGWRRTSEHCPNCNNDIYNIGDNSKRFLERRTMHNQR